MDYPIIKSGLLALAFCLSGTAAAEKSVISIESWRAEDQALWDELILPVFEAQHPDIDVRSNRLRRLNTTPH